MQSPPAPPPPPPPQPIYYPARVEEGGQGPERPQSSELVFCLNATHNLTQICLGGVVVSALILPNIARISGSYAQHIYLCTFGYFILMAQAILSFSPFGWANNLKYENKRIIHFVMQAIGSILAISGSIIRMIDTDFSLETAHGICGFIAMVLTICSLIGGVLTFIFPQMDSKFIKIAHSSVGSLTLSVAFVALIFAFHNYYRYAAGDGNANMAIVAAVLALVGTLLMAIVKNCKRLFSK